MNQDAVINQLAYATGKSRKEVIGVLKQLSAMPEVQRELNKHKQHDKKR